MTDTLTKVLSIESTKRMGFRMTMAMWRQLQVAIDREFIRSKWEQIVDSDSEEDKVCDLQATHSTRTAITRYGRTGSKFTNQELNQFRMVSKRFHEWWGLVSHQPREEGTLLSTRVVEVSPDALVQRGLKELLGAQASFKSLEQKECLERIVENKDSLVCILPTGGGKTLLIQLPAILERNKTTLVITPYVALVEDFIKRCKELKINCIEWQRGTCRRATIVVVVTDKATTGEFSTYIRDLHLSGKLLRIYFDEAHTLKTEVHFRHKFEAIKLLALPVQIVYLTGTFPPCMEDVFERDLLQNPKPKYVRSRTNRSEIEYSVKIVPTRDYCEEILKLIESENQKLDRDEKLLVFCTSKEQLLSIENELMCHKYYSNLEDKDKELDGWIRGKYRVMIATSALGAGINIAGVKCVIHVDKPYGLIQFGQESGRASREGQDALSIIMISEEIAQKLRETEDRCLVPDDLAMKNYLITNECRRKILSSYFDGRSNRIDCGDLSGRRCDNCQGLNSLRVGRRLDEALDDGQAALKRQRTSYDRRSLIVEDFVRQEGVDLERVKGTLERLQGECAACWILERGDDRMHKVDDCAEFRLGCESLDDVKRMVRYQANSCCFNCSRPGDMCKDYCDRGECDFIDVILPVIVLGWCWKIAIVMEAVELLAYKKFRGKGEFCRWLGQSRRVVNMNGTNAFGVFVEIIKKKI